MKQKIDEKFDQLDEKYQGGVVYIKLIYDILLDLRELVVALLKQFVKNFAVKGLYKYSV